jgi:hypothetical protein
LFCMANVPDSPGDASKTKSYASACCPESSARRVALSPRSASAQNVTDAARGTLHGAAASGYCRERLPIRDTRSGRPSSARFRKSRDQNPSRLACHARIARTSRPDKVMYSP